MVPKNKNYAEGQTSVLEIFRSEKSAFLDRYNRKKDNIGEFGDLGETSYGDVLKHKNEALLLGELFLFDDVCNQKNIDLDGFS